MFKNASFAAPLQTAVGFDGGTARVASSARPPVGLSWRHVATVGLLLVTLPVLAAAAVVSLPVMLLVAGAAGARKAWQHWQAGNGTRITPLR
jgi:hypothetical protein